jgi:hypothetical protein
MYEEPAAPGRPPSAASARDDPSQQVAGGRVVPVGRGPVRLGNAGPRKLPENREIKPAARRTK